MSGWAKGSLPDKIRDLLGIVVEVNLRSEGGREYLEVVTPAYSSPISYRGHYYQRSGSTVQELKGAALDRFLLPHYGRTWDGLPMAGVKTSDLSAASFTRFRQLAARSGRLDAAALAESDAGLLEKLKLTEGSYLKRAAVLLFHLDPLRFVTVADRPRVSRRGTTATSSISRSCSAKCRRPSRSTTPTSWIPTRAMAARTMST